jgi:2-amino-4-hydroxy-6-hydroxymethyldihydropteridine diphosphokinase
MSTIYLGLGTNIGKRTENIDRALAGLAAQVRVTAVSHIYETAAWGIEDQPDFLNLCLAGETELEPRELLIFVKGLEVELGREDSLRWGPRLMDIDILFYDDLILDEPGLTIPHKGIPDRATVLVPLADIAPNLLHPQTGATVRDMLSKVNTDGVWPFVSAA